MKPKTVAKQGSRAKPVELIVEGFAQIAQARIPFGALTVLVGPQATGKSLVLQLLKLAIDGPAVAEELERQGFAWERDASRFADLFFGQGMRSAWRGDTKVLWKGQSVPRMPTTQGRHNKKAKVFYIPAQRTLTIPQGWPRPFTDYDPDTPFVVRQFSEILRVLMNQGLTREGRTEVFPKTGRLSAEYRNAIDDAIFHGALLRRAVVQGRNQLQLRAGAADLSFMSWTAGQREFIPLLLGLYHLMPSGKVSKIDDVDWVIVEEPEMGLHPKGILAAMALLLELVARGYRVVVSTHSPTVLDVVWAMNMLEGKPGGCAHLARALGIGAAVEARLEVARAATRAVIQLDHAATGARSLDISGLDAGAEEEAERGWGGLTGLDGRIGDEVAQVGAVRNSAGRKSIALTHP